MSITDPCYEHIIGLSRTACDCFDYTADDMISDSDLYLDELEPLNSQLIVGREDCEKGELADIMRNARDEAIKTFKSDIIKELMQWNEPTRQHFKGSIGTLKFTNNVTLNTTYAGMRIMGADVRSGYLRITNIRTVFNETLAPFELYIYNNIGDLVETVLISSTAGVMDSNVVDIELPLHYDFLGNTTYFLVYETSGKTPKNIQSGCDWDTLHPCFTKCHKGWESWLMVSGYTTDDLTSFIDHNAYYGGTCLSNGLILDVELICKTEEVVCKDEMDYTGNPLAMSSAFAVRYMAGIKLIESLLGDTELNRYTMMNRETMVNFRAVFLEDYQKEIQYLGEKIDINNNDCLKCLDNYGFMKKTIFA